MAITKVKTGVIADSAVTTTQITDATVTSADMAVDPTNASNLSSGSVPLAQLGNAPATDLDPLEDDIAVLGFQVAAASDLAQYNLRDQIVNTFQDTSGIDASASTGEVRNASSKYYSGGLGPPTGGTITTVGANTVHTFLTSGSFIVPAGAVSANTDFLVVGGGGSGSKSYGGAGGGAGGFRYVTAQSISTATFTVTVGDGGPQKSGTSRLAGADGEDSVVSGTGLTTITATGGGYGGNGAGGEVGGDGGSGGGGGWTGIAGGASSPVTSPVQGYAGGTSGASNNVDTSGGGGGAGGVGESMSGTSQPGADGGPGVQNNIDGLNYYYAGGGAAATGTGSWNGGAGGIGGGGGGGQTHNDGGAGGGSARNAGGDGNASNVGGAGGANTGGGGGGAAGPGTTQGTSGAGGSGIVIISFVIGSLSAVPNNMTLVSTATTAEAGTTATADFVILYTPATGTTTLNTHLIASVSRDNGTTYTAATLVGKGSYSGTTQIATAHNIDISGQPAGVAMRWKIATSGQSLTRDTYINGVSLGWS